MSENQNNFELNNEELKEIEIEEVEKLLALIGDGKDVFNHYSFSSLDGDRYSVESFELDIMEKLNEISTKKEFVEELLCQVRKAKGEDMIDNIGQSGAEGAGRLLDFFNTTQGKTEIVKNFEENKNLVNNAYLKKYLEYENQRLESGGEINDWTFLLMSYIENQLKGMTNGSDSIIDDLKRVLHNSTQENYIKSILGNEKGFNNYFLQGYNHEISNYLIKIDDFEEILRDGSTNILDENFVEYEENPNQINSKALGNYFLYLEDNGQLNKETLLNKIGLKKMAQLYEIWGEEDGVSSENQIAKNLLENKGIFEEIKEVINIGEEVEEIGKNIGENNDYINNELSAEYISRNTDLIYSLTNKDKLEEVLDLLPEGEKIGLDEINPEIIKNFILHEKVKLGYYGIQEIPKEIFDNAIGVIIYKLKNSGEEDSLINELLTRAVYLQVDKEILRNKVEEYDILIPAKNNYINIYLNEMNVVRGLEFRELLEKYDNFENIESKDQLNEELNPNEINLLTEYILQTLDQIHTQRILSKLISIGFNGANEEFLNIPTNNTEIANALINRDPDSFKNLPIEARGNKETVDNLLSKIKQDSEGNQKEMMEKLGTYYNSINTNDINIFLKVYKFIDENAPWGGIEEMPNEIKILFMTEKAKNSIANSIGGGLSNNIDADNTQIFLKLINLAESNKYNIMFSRNRENLNISRESYNDNYESGIEDNEKAKRRENFVEGIIQNIEDSNLIENNDDKDKIYEIIESLSDISSYEQITKEKIDEIYLIITTELFCSDDIDSNEREQKITELMQLINDEFLSYNAEEIQEKLNNIELGNVKTETLESLETEEIEDQNGNKIEVISSDSITNYYRQFISENIDFKGDFNQLFLEENFVELTEEQKEIILKLIEAIDTQAILSDIKNNTEAYKTYLRNGKNGDFRSYLIEEIGEEEYINQLNNPIETNNQNFQNSNNSINNYSNETGRLSFTNSKGFNTTIELNQDEKNIVESSPEALDNIINFYNLLNDVGLAKLWETKDTIFNSISNVEGIGFNIDGDYLNENEVKIFINKILKSVGIDEISTILDINSFKGQLLNINKTQVLGGQETNFMYGETYLENMFIEKYLPRGSVFGLLTTDFENAIA